MGKRLIAVLVMTLASGVVPLTMLSGPEVFLVVSNVAIWLTVAAFHMPDRSDA